MGFLFRDGIGAFGGHGQNKASQQKNLALFRQILGASLYPWHAIGRKA